LNIGLYHANLADPIRKAADRELSDLDARFKGLWDVTHAAPHTARLWAMKTRFKLRHLD